MERSPLIEFTEDMVTSLNNSFKDQMIVMIASAGKAGMPDIAFKGSALAWDKEHIAFWERSLGTTFRNLQENGQCCLLYRNTATRQAWKFFGVAEVHTSGEIRDQVMVRTVEQELARDPARYLPLWRYSIPAEFADRQWDYSKFHEGERFVHKPFPMSKYRELIEQMERWGLDDVMEDKIFEHLVLAA